MGIAEGNIIAAIMIAHISQTMDASLNVQADCIGIMDLVRGACIWAADQNKKAQPLTAIRLMMTRLEK